MIRINLLPYRAARSKENIRKQISIFLLSFVLLIVVLVVYNSHLSSKKERLSNNLDNVKKQVAIYEAKAKEVEEIKKKLDLLNQQIEIVNQLKTYREKSPKLLAKMTEMVVPGRMQLSLLISNDTELMMCGFAVDNETIAAFMTRLERSGLFAGVTLNSTEKSAINEIVLKEFNITCKQIITKIIVTAPVEAPATKQKKGETRNEKN